MSSLSGSERDYYVAVFRLHTTEGYVRWKPVPAYEWMRQNFSYSAREMNEFILEFLEQGGEIDKVKETRKEFPAGFHYDIRMEVDNKRVYFETLLSQTNGDPEDGAITIVNMHWE